MTLEDLIALARTPLPGPPRISPEQMARVRAGLAGLLPEMNVPELPRAPQWLLDYGAAHGGGVGSEAEQPGTGGWRDVPLGAAPVNDTTGPFPQNQRFADIVRQYDALFRNAEGGERVSVPRAGVLQSALEGR